MTDGDQEHKVNAGRREGEANDAQGHSERRTIDKLRLINFTAFKDLTMEFSPGINAIIGENATGKTHVLKVLFAACT
jgi:ABC-type multidrug transport system ATPase subunit